MKLKERLKQLGDEFVYIGSYSAFFYIGKASDAFKFLKKASDNFEKDEKAKRELALSAIETYESRRESAMEKVDYYKERLKNAKKGEDKDFYKYALKSWNLKIKKMDDSHERNKRRVDPANKPPKRTPYLEREIKEEYERRWISPRGKIIVVEGDEFGMFYTYKEFLEVQRGNVLKRSKPIEEVSEFEKRRIREEKNLHKKIQDEKKRASRKRYYERHREEILEKKKNKRIRNNFEKEKAVSET